MKKAFDRKIVYGLIFSFVLFVFLFYFINNTLLLGASVSPDSNQTSDGGDFSPPTEATPTQQEPSAVINNPSQEQQAENNAAESLPKNTYIVKPGQTLWEIAQELGLSLTALMNYNQLSNSFIIEGQVLSYN